MVRPVEALALNAVLRKRLKGEGTRRNVQQGENGCCCPIRAPSLDHACQALRAPGQRVTATRQLTAGAARRFGREIIYGGRLALAPTLPCLKLPL